MKVLSKRWPMVLVAILLPPLYFVFRKRYLIAFVVGVIMVALANWKAYGPIFGIVLALLAELVQIGYELTHTPDDTQPSNENNRLGNLPRTPRPGPAPVQTKNQGPLSRFND